MSTIVIEKLKSANGFGEGVIRKYPEAADQTFIAGSPVVLSSGKVAEAGSDVGAAQVFGIALDKASGEADTLISVLLVTPEMEFEGNYLKNDGSAGIATAATIVGTELPLGKYSTTGKYGVYASGGAKTACVLVRAISPKDAVGDVGGRVIFSFQNTVLSNIVTAGKGITRASGGSFELTGAGQDHIADPTDAATTQAAVISILTALETAKILKTE